MKNYSKSNPATQAKKRWNAENYTQIKVHVDPKVASAFKHVQKRMSQWLAILQLPHFRSVSNYDSKSEGCRTNGIVPYLLT
jgi:Cft2 family RNA processing exonuclease